MVTIISNHSDLKEKKKPRTRRVSGSIKYHTLLSWSLILAVPTVTFKLYFCCFICAERHGLKEAKKAEQIQMKIINALREHITYSMSDSQRKSYYFSRLLAKLPELRSLSVQGLQRIFYLKLEDLVPAPPLIENMFIASLPF